MDVVHCHGWGGGSFIGIIGARLAGVPLVINGEHGGFYLEPHHIMLQRVLALFCKTTVCVSQSLLEEVVKNLGIKESRLTAIPNGVDTDVYTGSYPLDSYEQQAFFRATSDGEKKFVVGCIGSLRHYKNQLALLQVVKRIAQRHSVPGLRSVFIGDGPDREALQAFVSQSCIGEYVTFLGRRNDVPQLLSAIDVLVSTSLPNWEGLPNVMLEAMASGVPVVSFRSVGTSEVVIDGFNGFLLSPDDLDGLQNRIEMLALNGSLLDEMGRNAREFACRQYSIDKMVSSYERVYVGLPQE